MKITLELEVHEAFMILDPIQDKALTASKLAAQTHGDEHEIADLTAKVCGRVATRIVDGLFPPTLADIRWQDRLDEAEMGLA